MINSYELLTNYLVKFAGMGFILCAFILLICIISIRSENRKIEFALIGLFQSLFEFVLGLWTLFTKPIFVYTHFNLIIGILAIILIFSMVIVRAYFLNILRAMFSK